MSGMTEPNLFNNCKISLVKSRISNLLSIVKGMGLELNCLLDYIVFILLKLKSSMRLE